MCARFHTPWQTSAERYWNPVQSFWSFEASWRVSPTAPVPVVLTAQGERNGRMMRAWALCAEQGPAAHVHSSIRCPRAGSEVASEIPPT